MSESELHHNGPGKKPDDEIHRAENTTRHIRQRGYPALLSCVVEAGREVPASTLGINAATPKKGTSSQVGAQV